MNLAKGQIWELYSSTVVGDSSLIGRFELNRLEGDTGPKGAHDRIVHLTNLETGGVAKVFTRALREGPARAPHHHWRLAS